MTDTQAKRSGCLTAFIIVLIVLYALGAIGSFLAGPILENLMPEYAGMAGNSVISAILAILNIVFLIGVWKYKKWGFYGFVAVAVIDIIYSLYMGGGIADVIGGLIFPIILYFLIRSIWNHMD